MRKKVQFILKNGATFIITCQDANITLKRGKITAYDLKDCDDIPCVNIDDIAAIIIRR